MRASFVLGAVVCGVVGVHCAVSGDLGRVDNDSGVSSEAGADPDGFIGTNPGFIRVTPETTTLEIADGNTSGKSVAYTAEQKQPEPKPESPLRPRPRHGLAH